MSKLWPELSREAGRETWTALHLFGQISGKVRLALTPWVNHSWHATHYISARGWTTGLIRYAENPFEIEYDFFAHQAIVRCARGDERRVALAGQSVASFHQALLRAVAELGIEVRIHPVPSEIPDPTPFSDDRAPREYLPEQAERLWRAMVQIERVFSIFRTGFIGKVSPVHLFWGAFDLAVTRFSGRRAPPHPGGIPALPDEVTREAYSHEVSSAGFWPGGMGIEYPAFYSYAYPAPPGFAEAKVHPGAAFFESKLGEFVLPYAAVQTASDPDRTLLEFLQSTYEAAAVLGDWPRGELECAIGKPGVPRELK